MGVSRGKQFEQKVKEDLLKLEGCQIERFPDQMSGYRGSSNPSDFILYRYPCLYYLECKSTYGNTFPISSLTQYDSLLERCKMYGVRSGVIVWFIDHDVVCYVPIKTFQKLVNDNKKSLNIKDTKENSDYKVVLIPSRKRRVFLDSDYSVLFALGEGD